MEKDARSELSRWLGRDPWPKVFAVVTVIAFGVAILVSGIRPWGIWVAALVVGVWGFFVIGHGIWEDRRQRPVVDRSSFRARFKEQPVALGAEIVFIVLGLGAWSRMAWLIHTEAPSQKVNEASAGFWAVLLVGWVVKFALDSIYHRVEHRRERGAL